jgi:hypothetical protein
MRVIPGFLKKCSPAVVLLVAIVCAAPLLAQTAASASDASPVAGAKRPAGVPEGYAITPFGYFHPSCVLGLAPGEKQLPDGRVRHANGSVDQKAPVCNYPHYTRSGVPVTGANATAPPNTPTINFWLENANITTGSAGESYGGLTALWTVPPQPAANEGQTLFFFPGLEDIFNPHTSILQPVLAWYGGQWSIAGWNCCLADIVVHSPFVGVNPGDNIFGAITSNCAPGSSYCDTWNIFSIDLQSGQSTTLSNTPSAGQVFNWAFGAVLEVYGVNSCDDYPKNRQASFSVVVLDEHLHPIGNPDWSTVYNSTDTPQCNYAVNTTPHRVALLY